MRAPPFRYRSSLVFAPYFGKYCPFPTPHRVFRPWLVGVGRRGGRAGAGAQRAGLLLPEHGTERRRRQGVQARGGAAARVRPARVWASSGRA
eukprot:355908-Chlamydomonas_euryale.AAC.12